MGECFLHGQGGAGGGEADTRFKDLIEGTLTEVSDSTITSIRNHAFYECPNLTSADFPSATSMGEYAFGFCPSLISVNFPLVTSMGSYIFSSCSSLTNVNLPLVTLLKFSIFYGCSSLKSVDFLLVTSIDTRCFASCSSLTSLIIRTGQVCTLKSTNAFSDTPIASGMGYIYVPSALIGDYKTAANWSTYAAQFRALEEYTVDGTTTGELDPTKI